MFTALSLFIEFQSVRHGLSMCCNIPAGMPSEFGAQWFKVAEKLFWVLWLCFECNGLH